LRVGVRSASALPNPEQSHRDPASVRLPVVHLGSLGGLHGHARI
jgi:hypothetical protein